MKRAQSTLEYAMIVVILVAALIAMQIYIKRSMQGRLRAIADDLGQQYAPKNTTSDITITSESDQDTKVETIRQYNATKQADELKTTTTITINKETDTRSGNETVGVLGSSLF